MFNIFICKGLYHTDTGKCVLETCIDIPDLTSVFHKSCLHSGILLKGKPKHNNNKNDQWKCQFLIDEEKKEINKGKIVVVCAGTSDLPVAREAYLTAQFLGNEVELVSDVGVAGIHRLFHRLDVIQEANVLVVCAGMEGALASVVGGLVDKPVIAVPTSIGYGANFEGLSALLAMLNSCASGVSVVNIDNGFGAGYMAHTINCLGGKK